MAAGRHSLKTGYEYQHVAVEVQDVNPLYGRDAYAGPFTRPAGAAANNLYNLADFMLGLRLQYTLSNVLVAHIRQDLHFAYAQDDYRLNDRLTLNLGLRYEYRIASVGSEQRPVELRPGDPHDAHRQRRIRPTTGRSSIPTGTTSARGSGSPGRSRRRRSSVAGGASATCTRTASAPRTSCRSTVRR